MGLTGTFPIHIHPPYRSTLKLGSTLFVIRCAPAKHFPTPPHPHHHKRRVCLFETKISSPCYLYVTQVPCQRRLAHLMAMEAPTSCSSESLKHSGLRRACGGPLIQPLHLSHCSSPCQALSYPRGESPTTSSRNLLWCVTSHSVFPLTCFNFLRYLRLLPLARPLFVSDRAGVADAGSPGRLPRPTTPAPRRLATGHAPAKPSLVLGLRKHHFLRPAATGPPEPRQPSHHPPA